MAAGPTRALRFGLLLLVATALIALVYTALRLHAREPAREPAA